MGLKEISLKIIRPVLSALFGGSFSGSTVYLSGMGEGYSVDENSKLNVAAYYACIRNIAEDCAKIPFRLLQASGRQRIALPSDPLITIFNRYANPEMSAYSFRTTMHLFAAGWGNAYAEIVRGGFENKVLQLWPIHPSRVTIERYPDQSLSYKIISNNGQYYTLPENRVFKYNGISPDGQIGFSVLRLMANTLGVALSTQNFTKNFFDNQARPAGILSTTDVIEKTHRDELRREWKEMYSGPSNAGRTAIVDSGLQYQALTMPLVEAELIEMRLFTIKEICSYLRMPLYKIGIIERAQGWSTLDAQESDYVNSCLMPWIIRFEQEVQRQLMGDLYEDTIDAHLEVKGLLRGDMKSRMEFYKALFGMAAITPNEIRQLEDMNPVEDEPNMDMTFVQGAQVPIDKAGTLGTAGAAQGGSSTEPEPEPEPTPAPAEEDEEEDEAEATSQARIPARTARMIAAIGRKNGNGVHHG